MRSVILSAIAAAGVLAAAAGGVQAGSIQISGVSDGSFALQSSSMSNLFSGGSASFNSDALNLIQQELNSSGVNTNGVVTILAIDTGAGLSLIALAGNSNGALKWTSTADSANGSFIGNNGQSDLGGGSSDLAGDGFNGGSTPFGAGLGWANLGGGDSGNFNFGQAIGDGAASGPGYQFVTWNGTSWQIINSGSIGSGSQSSFEFNFTVVPVPKALLMGIAGLIGVAGLMFAIRRSMK